MRDAQGARGAHHSVVELLLLAGKGACAGQHDAIHRCAVNAGHAAGPAGQRGPLHAHGRLRHKHRRAHALLVLVRQRCGGGHAPQRREEHWAQGLRCCICASATGNADFCDAPTSFLARSTSMKVMKAVPVCTSSRTSSTVP